MDSKMTAVDLTLLTKMAMIEKHLADLRDYVMDNQNKEVHVHVHHHHDKPDDFGKQLLDILQKTTYGAQQYSSNKE